MTEETTDTNNPQDAGVKVFISYSTNDLTAASVEAQLSHALREKGVASITSQTKANPGENWADTLKKAIKESRFLILLLSRDTTTNTPQDWSTICEVLWGNPNIKIIPILIDDARLPPFLKDRKYSVARGSNDLAKCVDDISCYILELRREGMHFANSLRNKDRPTIVVLEDLGQSSRKNNQDLVTREDKKEHHQFIIWKDLDQSIIERYSSMIAAIKQSIDATADKKPDDSE